MKRSEIKVGMSVKCLGKICKVVAIVERPPGNVSVHVEANGHTIAVSPDDLVPVSACSGEGNRPDHQ